MKNWSKKTLSDSNGNPSFKRQFALFLSLVLNTAIFYKLKESIETLSLLITTITTGTVIEKFTKPKNEL